jgi:hypothetical protein
MLLLSFILPFFLVHPTLGAEPRTSLEQRLFSESEKLLESKQIEPARRRIGELERRRPKDLEIVILKARLSLLEGKPSRALAELEQPQLQLEPASPEKTRIQALKIEVEKQLATDSSQNRGTLLKDDWEVLRLDGQSDQLLVRRRAVSTITLKEALERSPELMIAFASRSNTTAEPLGRQDVFEQIAANACAQSLVPGQTIANISLKQALFEVGSEPTAPALLNPEVRVPLFGMTRFRLEDHAGENERFKVTAALVLCRDPKSKRVSRMQWRGSLEAAALWEQVLYEKLALAKPKGREEPLRYKRLREVSVRALRARRLQVEAYRSRLAEDQSQKLVTPAEVGGVNQEIARQLSQIDERLARVEGASKVSGGLGTKDQLLIHSLYRTALKP